MERRLLPLPAPLSRSRLTRYDAPAFGLRRLAVDRAAQGRSLGGALSVRVVERCLPDADEVGGVAPSPWSCANGWIASLRSR